MTDIASRFRMAALAADALSAIGILVHGAHTFTTKPGEPLVLYVARIPNEARPIGSKKTQAPGDAYIRKVTRAAFRGVILETVEHLHVPAGGPIHVLH